MEYKHRLKEGVILARPNRFLMTAQIDGKQYTCHCPATGSIAGIKFSNTSCLVSEHNNPKRRTKYTVEAISLDPITKKKKSWIGINQGKANDYIAHIIKNNQLKKLFPKITSVKREVTVGKSRIDFLINNNCLLEVKTPLREIYHNGIAYREQKPLTSFDRMIKHFNTMRKGRTILLLCYLHDAPPFSIPKTKEKRIINAAKRATKNGMEHWQINLKITPNGVKLIDYFKLNLF